MSDAQASLKERVAAMIASPWSYGSADIAATMQEMYDLIDDLIESQRIFAENMAASSLATTPCVGPTQ